MQVVLKAGDILYIPQHWWHHVRSFDCPNIAISLWFHPFAEKEEEQSSLEDDSADVRITISVVYFSLIKYPFRSAVKLFVRGCNVQCKHLRYVTIYTMIITY